MLRGTSLMNLRFVGQRSRSQFLKIRAEAKQVSNFCSIFRSCDLDLCPTNLNNNRLPPLTFRHVCTKFHLYPTFRSYQFFVLFLEVVTLTFINNLWWETDDRLRNRCVANIWCLLNSRVATKSNSAYNMMNVVRVSTSNIEYK
jgi:hypothetical protein